MKSSVTFEERWSPAEVFHRLGVLLDTQGTDVSVDGNTLAYEKSNPAAQDKLATFTSGTLEVVEEDGGTRLSYDVASTALFLCFLAPLAFLAFGQFAAFINEIEKPGLIAELEEEKQKEEEAGKDEKVIELHWIDQMLGAPAPEKPGEEDDEEATRDGTRWEREEEEVEGNHSPVTAYVIAGIFAAIYLVGRFLEPYLLKRTFRWALTRASEPEALESDDYEEADTKFVPPERNPEKT